MSRALRSGAPHILGRHDGAAGRAFDRHYRDLATQFGPLRGTLRDYAAGVAALWVRFKRDTEALHGAEATRRHGKGRRPSAQAIERLRKRQALTWGTYDSALRRLQELAALRPKGSPLAAVQRAVERANGR